MMEHTMNNGLEQIEKSKCFAGEMLRYKHFSQTLNCNMNFSIFIPPIILEQNEPAPVLYWLSGLTCTDQNFMQKSGAQRIASDLGIILVAPDTSPRGEGVPNNIVGSYDLGIGAGFYLNATEEPWSDHYQMYDYIRYELPEIINQNFLTNGKQAISGHSMGGHGALVIGLRNQDFYTSISAFSPITNPMNCPWGQKAFTNYLGADKEKWRAYDACEIIKDMDTNIPIRIDQGSEDQFLYEQLLPENFTEIAEDDEMNYFFHAGYDHSYYFIASYIEDHLRFHFANFVD
jgi:S-formylglutathione hydrolase